MFNKIKEFFQGKAIQASAFQDIGSLNNRTGFNKFTRQRQIQNLLNGYQYIAGDIVSKSIASQRIRLYGDAPDNNQVIRKYCPVSYGKLQYFSGESELKCSDKIRAKTLSNRNGIVEILEHPALDLLQFQNPYSNYYQFLYTLALGMQIYGNSFFRKIRDGLGNPVELWYSPPQYMDIKQGKTLEDFIINYRWGEQIGKTIDILPKDILDFKIPGVGNSQVYGTSKIEVAFKYIQLLNNSLEFQNALQKNMGRADFILIAKNVKKFAAELKRVESDWNNQFRGVQKAGQMTTIPGDLEPFIVPRTEIPFDKDLPIVRAISSAFGLPEYKILGSSPRKANATQQEKDYLMGTVQSYLTLIEEILNENLLSEYKDSDKLFFAFDPVLQEDKTFMLRKQTSLLDKGVYTINFVKGQEGLEPVEGGDIERIGGKPINQINNPTPITEENETQKQVKDQLAKIINKIEEPKGIIQPAITKEVEPVTVITNVNNYNSDEVIVKEEEEDENKNIEVEEEPNKETIKSLENIENGDGLHEVEGGVDELFKELDLDDEEIKKGEIEEEKNIEDDESPLANKISKRIEYANNS